MPSPTECAASGAVARAAACSAAEGFLEVAFARGINVKTPFADQPHVVELRLAGEFADPRERRVYADFLRYEILRIVGGRVVCERHDETRFLPSLFAICRGRAAA